jgi:hypothetical protein
VPLKKTAKKEAPASVPEVFERIGEPQADVPLKGLNFYFKNPRRGNVEKVAESLKANGQFKQIVVNRGSKTGRPNEILAGNHTVKAAKSLGWTKINVNWVDVDEEHARRIVLADNGSTDDATYDAEILAELLQQQKEGVGHLVGTTYNEEVVNKLLVEMNTDPLASIDSIEDAPSDLSGVEELSRYVFFDSDLPYDIPPLKLSMIPEKLPEKLDIWAGHEIDSDRARDENQWWLGQWHTGNRGIPFERTILSLYCVDDQTEALTARGWVSGEELREDDTILSMRPDGVLAWSSISSIFRKQYKGKMHRLTKNNIDALVTPNHKFALADGTLKPVDDLLQKEVLRVFGEAEDSAVEVYSDAFVELVGWSVTEGNYRSGASIVISQKEGFFANQIRLTLKRVGAKFHEATYINPYNGSTMHTFYFSGEIGREVKRVSWNRVLSAEFLCSLSAGQRKMLVDTMVNGDGWVIKSAATRCYTQKDRAHVDAFVMLCSLAGIPTSVQYRDWDTAFGRAKCYVVNLKVEKTAHVRSIDFHGGQGDRRRGIKNQPTEDYEGLVWCPSTEYGTFVCRRNGIAYVTGNTEDFHFTGLFDDPSMNTKKILNTGIPCCISPNYSVNQDWPSATWIWAAYRSAYVARYWQEAGLFVIPDIQYGGSDEALALCLHCIPEEAPVVAAQVQTLRGDNDRIRTTARLLKKAEEQIGFQQILLYGHTDADKVMQYAGFDCEVVRVENRTTRRREILDAGTTVKSSKQVRSKKRTSGYGD